MQKHFIAQIFGVILIASLFMSGCGLKWRKTTSLVLRYELVKTDEDLSFLTIESGSIYLDRFEWESTRDQSRDVKFEEPFESSLYIDAGLDNAPLNLIYDIPQGTYTDISTTLRLDAEEEGNSILLGGNFQSSTGDTIPFAFKSPKSLDIELESLFPNGENEITFIEDGDETGTIQLNLIDWFGETTENMFLTADLSMLGADSTLTFVIAEDSNENIYDAVLSRIGQSDIFDLN